MKFLLTNDDGILAPGLEALERLTSGVGECVLIAPSRHLSGCSHRVTTDQPIRIRTAGKHRWAVEGTPADCVRVGLAHLVQDIHWVFSGINEGSNLGVDVHHSGTVAAVREAALHGIPGIALSHYRKRGRDIDWDRALAWMTPLVQELLSRPWKPGTFYNVNLPHLQPGDPEPKIVFCPLESAPLPLSFRLDGDESLHYNGDYHQRRRRPGTDVDICFNGQIAVTVMQA